MQDQKLFENLAGLVAQQLTLTEKLVGMFDKVESACDSAEERANVVKLRSVWRTRLNDRVEKLTGD